MMPIDFRTCSLPERIEALQKMAVPLSSSGRVEWDGGTACDVVVNLTGAPVRLEIDGGLLTIDLPEHGTARDLPPQHKWGFYLLHQPAAQPGQWPHEEEPRVFFLLGPADRAPGRPDILRVDSGGKVTRQGSPPALWVTDCICWLPLSAAHGGP